MEIIPGPDFPTGGIILGRAGIRSAYHDRPRLDRHARARRRPRPSARDREALIITEIPYQVNKATMIEKIAELVRDKRIEGISDIRDECDRDGMRVVIELKRDAMADVVLNQLYRFSALQTSLRRQHGGAERRPAGGDEAARTCSAPSSPSARRWSAGGPSSCSTRRATAPTCWSASPSPSPISTR